MRGRDDGGRALEGNGMTGDVAADETMTDAFGHELRRFGIYVIGVVISLLVAVIVHGAVHCR